jgi:NAD(P)-dependent dehydrogenase (short-subunit alcohol dehydrogenase family)
VGKKRRVLARCRPADPWHVPAMSEPSRVWFVTGCSSGFGRALAEEIVARGDRLLATARQTAALDDLAARAPDHVRAFALDVTDAAQVRAVVGAAAAEWGRLDVVVNNAGYGLIGALEEYDDAQIRRNFATNLFGPIHVLRAALPFLRAQKAGHIVNLSAAAAIANYAGFSVYGAAKCALEGLSEALAQELRPFGVKVTLVQPGPFRTDFIARSLDRAASRLPDYDATAGKFAQFLERVNGKQPGDPRRAASAIVDLVHAGQAPLRFVLGKYAVGKVRKKLADTERELAQFEAAGLATDFPAA